MKPVAILKHIPCEGAGRFYAFAEARRIPYREMDLPAGDVLPALDDISALLVLGGSMNVYEEEKYPWLQPETELMAAALAADVPILGICLGAQLLAKAAGGLVTKNSRKEIGNYSVQLTEEGRVDPLFQNIYTEFPVFQWHGDTFSGLGPGGVWLARSAWCRHQAFRTGRCAYGVQFHVEVTPEIAREWCHEYNTEVRELRLNATKMIERFVTLEPEYAVLSEKLFSNFFRAAGLLA